MFCGCGKHHYRSISENVQAILLYVTRCAFFSEIGLDLDSATVEDQVEVQSDIRDINNHIVCQIFKIVLQFSLA